MNDFVVFQHHHYGWTKNARSASSTEEAMSKDIYAYHRWLSDFPHELTFDGGRYAVTYEGAEPRFLPLGHVQRKGDHWFGDQVRIGRNDDCSRCGGTRVDHYSIFKSCRHCVVTAQIEIAT